MISPLSTFSSIVLEVSSCVFSEVPELPAEELSFSPEVPCDLFSFAGVFSEVPDFWGAFVGFGVAAVSYTHLDVYKRQLYHVEHQSSR